jgi:hypothetical protein
VRGWNVGHRGDLGSGVVDEPRLLHACRKLGSIEAQYLLELDRAGADVEDREPGTCRRDYVLADPGARIRDPPERGRRSRKVGPRLLPSGCDVQNPDAQPVLADDGDTITVRADRDGAPVCERTDFARSIGDEQLELLAEAHSVEEEPLSGPGIDDVVGRLVGPDGLGAMDALVHDDVAFVGTSGPKSRVDSLDEGDGPVVSPRSRVGASGKQKIAACVVVDPQRGNAERLVVCNALLREGPIRVHWPQLVPRVVGDELAVGRPGGHRRERPHQCPRSFCPKLGAASLPVVQAVGANKGRGCLPEPPLHEQRAGLRNGPFGAEHAQERQRDDGRERGRKDSSKALFSLGANDSAHCSSRLLGRC